MEIGYMIRDARKREVDPERTASKFDAAYYRGLLEMAWGEAAFVLTKPHGRQIDRVILSHLDRFCIFWVQSAPFNLIPQQAECLAISFDIISLENFEGIIVSLHAH